MANRYDYFDDVNLKRIGIEPNDFLGLKGNAKNKKFILKFFT